MRYPGITRYIKLKLTSGLWDNPMNTWPVEFTQ